jgi:phosphohistidine phosphatase
MNDFDRPLNARGKLDAPRMGQWLREQGLIPDWILSSPAERAAKTAKKVCRELGVSCDDVKFEPEIYLAEHRQLVRVLGRCPRTARLVMLFGHNPGLEDLLRYLAANSLPDTPKLMPTAAVAGLELSPDWSRLERDSGRMVLWMSPKSLA